MENPLNHSLKDPTSSDDRHIGEEIDSIFSFANLIYSTAKLFRSAKDLIEEDSNEHDPVSQRIKQYVLDTNEEII